MADKSPENCWEFWNCEKKIMENCPAYKTKSGRECWAVAERFEKKCEHISSKKFKHCWECPWFKKLNWPAHLQE